MQISAQTLLASQQAQPARPPQSPAPAFAAALEKRDGFQPLPLKQAAPMPENPVTATPQPAAPSRPGAMLDIRI